MRDRGGEHRIVAELDGGTVSRKPVFGVLEGLMELKAGGRERLARNGVMVYDGDIDIKRRPQVPLMN
jgi:hypothetical protein